MAVKASQRILEGMSGRLIGVIAVAVLMLFLLEAMSLDAQATQIYQWKDASGVTHFSDNPDMVPPQYREKSGRNISGLAGTRTSEATVSRESIPARYRGKEIWQSKCAECHYASGNSLKDGKRGLHRFIVNEQTNYPMEPEQVLPRFKYAVSGRTSSMPAIEISDDELNAMIKYLAGSLK